MSLFRSFLLTTSLSSLLMAPVWGMETGGDDSKDKGTAFSGRTSPSPEHSLVRVASDGSAARTAAFLAPVPMAEPHYNTAVTSQEWDKVIGLLNTAQHPKRVQQLANELGITPAAATQNILQGMVFNLGIFQKYFALYQSMNADKVPPKLKEEPSYNFFVPLRQFVFQFQVVYDLAMTHYREEGQDNSFLERDYLPIVQRTFNRMVGAWEQITGRKAATFGPLEPNEKLIINDGNQNKHLYYIRDEKGFLLFPITPEEPMGAPEDNYYLQRIPYRFFLSEEAFAHQVVFSVRDADPSKITSIGNFLSLFGSQMHSVTYGQDIRIVDNPGWCLERRDGGRTLAITPYSGGRGKFPYTSGKTITLLENKGAQALDKLRLIDAAKEKVEDIRREKEKRVLRKQEIKTLLETTSDDEQRKVLTLESTKLDGEIAAFEAMLADISNFKVLDPQEEKEASEDVPGSLKGDILFQDKGIEALEQFSPQVRKWINDQLGEHEGCFIPFPQEGIEDQEMFYLYFHDLQQRIQAGEVTEEDHFILEYAGIDPQHLPQAIESIEKELEEEYVSDEIQAEWARRQQQVVDGTIGAAPAKKGKNASKNKKKRDKAKAAKAAAAPHSSQGAGAVVAAANVGAAAPSPEDFTPQARERAKKRLTKLKEAQAKKGPLKFRKFMSLVSMSAQGLKRLGVKVEMAFDKGSSHGDLTLESKEGQSEKSTVVRPHGNQDMVHPKGKANILGNIVRRFVANLNSQRGAEAGNPEGAGSPMKAAAAAAAARTESFNK